MGNPKNLGNQIPNVGVHLLDYEFPAVYLKTFH